MEYYVNQGEGAEQGMREREPGKGRFDLLSPLALRKLAELLEKGAVKYEFEFEPVVTDAATDPVTAIYGKAPPLQIGNKLVSAFALPAPEHTPEPSPAVAASWTISASIPAQVS